MMFKLATDKSYLTLWFKSLILLTFLSLVTLIGGIQDVSAEAIIAPCRYEKEADDTNHWEKCRVHGEVRGLAAHSVVVVSDYKSCIDKRNILYACSAGCGHIWGKHSGTDHTMIYFRAPPVCWGEECSKGCGSKGANHAHSRPYCTKKGYCPNIIGVGGEVCDKPVGLPDSHRQGRAKKYYDADGGFTGKYAYNCLDKCPEGEADAWIYTPINLVWGEFGLLGTYCSAGNPLIEATEDRVCTYHKANPIPEGSTFYPDCTTILMHYIENKSSVSWKLLRQREQGIALANYKETPVAGGTDIYWEYISTFNPNPNKTDTVFNVHRVSYKELAPDGGGHTAYTNDYSLTDKPSLNISPTPILNNWENNRRLSSTVQMRGNYVAFELLSSDGSDIQTYRVYSEDDNATYYDKIKRSFSTSFLMDVEAGEPTPFWLKVGRGNWCTVNYTKLTLFNTDSLPPKLEPVGDLTSTWSREKVVPLKFTENGIGGVRVSPTGGADYERYGAPRQTGTIETPSRTITEEIAETKDYLVYVSDDLANIETYTYTVGKIDRTAPNAPVVTVTGEFIPSVSYQEVEIATAGDKLGEVDYAEYSTDKVLWLKYSKKFNLGMYSGKVFCRVIDKAGNRSPEVEVTVTADSIPPTLEGFKVDFSRDPSIWSSVNVIATASGGKDADSGIAGYEYSLNQGKTWTQSATVDILDYANLWYRIYDKAGNRSDRMEYEVFADGLDPLVPKVTKGVDDDAWVSNPADIVLTDLGDAKATGGKASGIQYLQYSLDGKDTWINLPYSDTLSYNLTLTESPKDFTLYVRSADKVGRLSTVVSCKVKLDLNHPDIDFEYRGNKLN